MKRPITHNDKKDKGIFLLEKLFPNIKNLAIKFGRKLENFDIAQPKTALRSFEQDFEGYLNTLSTSKTKLLVRFIRIFLLRNKEFQDEIIGLPADLVKQTKKLAKEDERYSLLILLMKQADENTPFVSLRVAFKHGDIRETLVSQFSPVPYLQEAHELKGEARAARVYEGMRHVCEYLYKPYIKTIWFLSYFRGGQEPPHENFVIKYPKFGNMINVCLEKLPTNFLALIETDAAFMRNSVSHHPLEYDPAKDSIILRDDNDKHLEISVDDLLIKIESMYQISAHTIGRVGQLYLFQLMGKVNICEILFPLLPELLSSDEGRVKKAEETIHMSVINKLNAISQQT